MKQKRHIKCTGLTEVCAMHLIRNDYDNIFYHPIFIAEHYGMRTAFPAVWCCIETVILKEEHSLRAGKLVC
jgi:hypothetical protein